MASLPPLKTKWAWSRGQSVKLHQPSVPRKRLPTELWTDPCLTGHHSVTAAPPLAGLDRVRQQGKKLGRPKVAPNVEMAIREHLSAENGVLTVAAMVGVGSGTVQPEMAEKWADAA